jgi:hypothetical protein
MQVDRAHRVPTARRKGQMMKKRLAMLAFAVVATAALVACGGSGESEESTADDQTSASLAFSECMRDNGVDVPDPEADGSVALGPDSGIDPQSPEFQEAQQACASFLEDVIPAAGSAEEAQVNEQLLEFTRCMRDEGIDMPDPQGGGGIAALANSGIDPQDPVVREAMETCQYALDGVLAGPGATE